MTTVRAVKIDTDGRIHEVKIRDLLTLFESPDNLGMDRLSSLDDVFTDLDGAVVMLSDLRGTEMDLQWNQKASYLVAPASNRHNLYVRGDVYFVGVGLTTGGMDIFDLPERVGPEDIRDLVERYEKR